MSMTYDIDFIIGSRDAFVYCSISPLTRFF